MPRHIREIPDPWATAMVQAGVTDPRNGERPSANQLAARTGATTTTITSLIFGERETDQGTIDAVAQVLRVKPATIASWSGLSRGAASTYVPPSDASLMTADQRKLVDGIIRQFTRQARANVNPSDVDESPTTSPGRVTPIRTRAPLEPPVGVAAKRRTSRSSDK